MAIKTIKRNRKKSNILQTFFFLILIGVIAFIFLHLQMFNITDINVADNNMTDEEEIIETSGIVIGNNIFRENLNDAAENIKKIPFIDDVSIDRKLPSTIIINIKERAAVLSVLDVDSASYIFDADGILLNKSYVYADYGIPVLTGFNVPDGLEAGAKCSSKELTSIIEIMNQTPDIYKDYIDEIVYTKDGQVVLYTTTGIGGWKIRFGDLSDIDEKIDALNGMWEQLLQKKDTLEYFDISYYKSPVIKYKS